MITAQAFQVNRKEHYPAIVLGLIPGIVAWGLLLVQATLAATGTFTLHNVGLDAFATTALAPVAGLISLERGFLFTCMIWSAATVHIIDRKFLAAAVWIGIAAVLSWFGLMHAYELTPQGIAYDYGFNVNPGVSIGYLLFGCYLVFVHLLRNDD